MSMADPHNPLNPISPISVLLKTLGMTREDLVQHTEQMRVHLSQSNPSPPADPLKVKSRSLSRSRTASLSNIAARPLSSTPPKTPVKSEPVEETLPVRQMDTMQMVIERKNKQHKRDRRDSASHSRDARRVSHTHTGTPSRSETPKLAPSTPHHYKYYSERVIGEASGSQSVNMTSYLEGGAVHDTPSRRAPRTAQFKSPSVRPPKTPVSRHIYNHHTSSSRPSTPGSSPARVVNIVSSPGPMRAELPADEDEADDLPYTLPPGPYSTIKPDFSYAALIGQAILSSPEHRLTLQDIYEWITTVYPYYTRGEQTWMNSIRHSLSTMAVFRKIPRGRNEGKSLWAIWDADIPCFANGGFRKTLCADMVKAKPHLPLKSGPKRKVQVMDDALAREAKKRKRFSLQDEVDPPARFLPPVYTGAVLPPFYAPTYPNAQQQPYYQPYVPQVLPADIIFPPLPPSSGYHRAMSLAAASASSASRPTTADMKPPVPSTSTTTSLYSAPSTSSSTPLTSIATYSTPSTSFAASEKDSSQVSADSQPQPVSSQPTASSLAVPELIGNESSSSSPPLSSEASLASVDSILEAVTEPDVIDPEDEVDRLTAQWLASPSVLDNIQPLHSSKAKSTPNSIKKTVRNYLDKNPFIVPDSPTLNRRSAAKGKARMRSPSPLPALYAPTSLPCPTTPPPRPCTPPRKRTTSGNTIQLSAQHTPISHRGLHMSPSPSLAHYKSHLDPPPAAVFHPQAPLLTALTTGEDPTLTLPSPGLAKTPSRRRTSGPSGSAGLVDFAGFEPVTPKRLIFNMQESPFRTPSRFFDPHDPTNLIDDEIKRMSDQSLQESPMGGLFGRRSLFDSPTYGFGSPSRYW